MTRCWGQTPSVLGCVLHPGPPARIWLVIFQARPACCSPSSARAGRPPPRRRCPRAPSAACYSLHADVSAGPCVDETLPLCKGTLYCKLLTSCLA